MIDKAIRELHRKKLKTYEDAASEACANRNRAIEAGRQTFLNLKGKPVKLEMTKLPD